MPTPSEYIEQYKMARNIVWRYQLDKLETESIRRAMSAIQTATRRRLAESEALSGAWGMERPREIERELTRLMAGLRAESTGEVARLAAQAGTESVAWHTQTLSMQGLLNVDNVSITAEQFRQFFQDTPLGGNTLGQWVDRAFDKSVITKLRRDLDAGVLTGKGYPALTDNIMRHMGDFTRREAVNLARSYVQSANVAASDAVMRANDDIVQAWKWSAILEPFDMETGRGTCIQCASLDGNKYQLGEGPSCPLHVNCRCTEIPVTVSWRELGIDADEIEDVARPWTIRDDVPIGEGGRNIRDYGFHEGEYAQWFESRGEAFQRTVLGPGRYELYTEGKIGFKDLVDSETGRRKTIKELVN